MQKVVLITGAGSGIGKATAKLFAQQGWQVVATMRDPSAYRDAFDRRYYLLPLDVTKSETITAAIQEVQQKFGRIDVLVNNAGYGLFGAFEMFTPEELQQQYDVNVFGTMHLCQAVLPMMRDQGNGTIVNISSMGGKFAVPFWGVYNSTKFAIEGLSEGLFYEMRPYGIKIKLVEPGVIDTDFYKRSMKTGTKQIYASLYKATLERMWKQFQDSGKKGARADTVAKVIYKAAMSKSSRLRYTAGNDAFLYGLMVKLLPHRIFMWLTRKLTLEKNS